MTPERRGAAPHPGPVLLRDYLVPLGLDSRTFALQIGAEPAVLDAMLAGRMPIDVEMAIRISRALQLSAERIMQWQIRNDFAKAREAHALRNVGLLQPPEAVPFPETCLNGRLGCGDRSIGNGGAYYFREDVKRHEIGDHYAGIHALWRGDSLRVFQAETCVWCGPVLEDFDGAMLLPYVTSDTWQSWFATSCRADLALGVEHAAYLASARK